MENILLKYYLGKDQSEEMAKASVSKKPVVTISREFGCPSKMIAQLLTETINKKMGEGAHKKWKFVNKEVLESAAMELELNPADVKYLINLGEKSLMEDFLVSFSSNYVSNLKVKHTLTNVVTKIANAGNVIIVGRGGAAILRGRRDSLHVRLQAPVAYRVRCIRDSRGISEEEAKRMTENIDKKRAALYELILGKKLDQYIFDAVFNCSTLSKEDIVKGTMGLMESMEML